MPSAFVLLRIIGKAVIKNAVKGVVNIFSLGVGGDILLEAWEQWQEASKGDQRVADVQALAAASPVEVAAAAAEIAQEEGSSLSDDDRLTIAEYLTQVPAMIHRSQRRPSDPEGKTVQPGATFKKARRPGASTSAAAAALPVGRPAVAGRRLGIGRVAWPGRFWRGVEGTESTSPRHGACGAEILPGPGGERASAATRGRDSRPSHAPRPDRRDRNAATHLFERGPAMSGI